MKIHLFIMALSFIDFAGCFNFEGSGDESSFNLTAEELIPFVTKPPSRTIIPKRKIGKSKPKKKKKDKSKSAGKGSRYPHHKKLMDPCKFAFCTQLCFVKGNQTQCGCHRGFTLDTDSKTCIDINECSELKNQCNHICVNTPGSFHCACHQHYRLQEGSNGTCEAVCDPPCLNNGECIGPNKCQCPDGYSEPGCTPLCDPPCANGGICKRWNMCKCMPNFYGPTCLNAICTPQCLNGGSCITPNVCHCRNGYYGRRCEKVKCNPPCQNNGQCVEGNVCLCLPEHTGSRCHITLKTSHNSSTQGKCNPHCKANRNLDGNHFNSEESDTLMDESVCSDKKTHDFKGSSCQRKKCSLLSSQIKTTKLVRMHVPENYVSRCGTASNRRCLRTRLVQKILPRIVYQRAYRIRCA